MKAPLSPREPQRLEALRQYQILDTASEEVFDGVTSLVSYICDTPMALISLVDEDRQWFKSEFGVGSRQTTLEASICAHAILHPGLFVVPDTKLDARFADNPLVLVENGLRFYAGVPLNSAEGYALGALCVLDRVPRELTARQRDALQTLSKVVMSLIELRRAHYEQMRVAHDLRNLASGIQGVAGLLSEDPSLNTSQRDDLQAILQAAERSVRLTQRSSTSRVTAPLDVNRTTQDVIQMVRRFLPTDVRLIAHLTPLNPQIQIEMVPFEQVLLNLLMNARDALGQKGEIFVTTEVRGEMTALLIRDTGAGIAPSVLPHIFERFYTTKAEGSGLGLATVRDIVRRNGGDVDVQSNENAGTTFTVTLPRVKDDQGAASVHEPEALTI